MSITTRTAIVTLEKEGFVRMTMLEGALLDLDDMLANHKAEREIANHKSHVILIEITGNSISSEEARRFSSGEEPTKYRLAVALLFKSLAGRITANSLINNYHPQVPTEKFDNEQEAIDWLESFLLKNT